MDQSVMARPGPRCLPALAVNTNKPVRGEIVSFYQIWMEIFIMIMTGDRAQTQHHCGS